MDCAPINTSATAPDAGRFAGLATELRRSLAPATVASRLGEERGAVYYFAVMAVFFILALVTVVFDVSRVSVAKMQMQAAADSAALEMAVWQCRGMNVVMNLNDEIYQTDEVVVVLYGIAGAMTGIAKILEMTIFLAEVGEAVEAAASVIAYVAYYVHKVIVQVFLTNVRMVYAKGTMLMGYLSANNAASANGAERIIPKIPFNGGGDSDILTKLLGVVVNALNGLTGGFVAIGIPTRPSAAIMLPLKEDDADSLPLDIQDPSGVGGAAYMALMVLLDMNTDFEAKDYQYKEKIFRSQDEKMFKIPPMIWMVHRSSDLGFVSRYFLGGDESDYAKIPILAYAIGQAQGGNVTMCADYDHPYRPRHYGVGADAFLVPIGAAGIPDSTTQGGVTIKFFIKDYIGKLFLH